MAGINKLTNAITHNLHSVGNDSTGAIIAKTAENSIAHNKINATNWADSVSNNGAAKGMREWGLAEPNSPAMRTGRDGKEIPVVTQGGIANLWSGHRGQLGEARKSLKGDINRLEGELDLLTKQGIDATGVTDALGAARREYSSFGTKIGMTIPKQAGSHIKRTLQWSQEGSAMDRVKKTAFVGGSYFGANAALRGATGGGLTYNNNGERDITGIPFL